MGDIMNYIAYLQRILDNPDTPREEYMRVWNELRFLKRIDDANQIAIAEYHKNRDKLTGGQNV